jgi:hypothetical protein
MLDLSVLRSTVPFLRRTATACLVLFSASACSDPPVDDRTPTPKGVIEGSMLYIGPRPLCTYVDGVATEVMGRVLLTIIDNSNPLPPEGTASLPVDFLAVGGEDIFSLDDCLPENATPADQMVVIMKSADFRWGDLPLAQVTGSTISYRIAGFYDQEGDFNPLFTVRQTNTRGDMAGAALENAQVANPQFKLVTFGSVQENPLGVKVTGIPITFGGFVQTEPPVFYVADGDMDAQAPAQVFPTTQIQLNLFSRSAADPMRVELDGVMARMGMAGFVNFNDPTNPIAYAWYQEAFDLNRNGMADEKHPIFMDPYRSPYIFLSRVQNAIELATGVPQVAIIPASADPERVRYPSLNLYVPSIAAMIVNPAAPFCRAVIAPPGSIAQIIAGNGTTAGECHELPTGYYGVNALNGVVGGTVQTGVAAGVSQTGFDIVGGQFSNQVWRLPNELGDCHQLGNSDEACARFAAGGALDANGVTPINNQSRQGTVVVHDPNENNAAGRREEGGDAACSGLTFPDFPVNPDFCCEAVIHLCDIPLCPYEDATMSYGGTYRVRGAPTSLVRGRHGARDTPNCMPFPIPQQCCDNQVPAPAP